MSVYRPKYRDPKTKELKQSDQLNSPIKASDIASPPRLGKPAEVGRAPVRLAGDRITRSATLRHCAARSLAAFS